jgi:hypothetical protein
MGHRQAYGVNSGEAGHRLQSRARDKREHNLKLGVGLPVLRRKMAFLQRSDHKTGKYKRDSTV